MTNKAYLIAGNKFINCMRHLNAARDSDGKFIINRVEEIFFLNDPDTDGIIVSIPMDETITFLNTMGQALPLINSLEALE